MVPIERWRPRLVPAIFSNARRRRLESVILAAGLVLWPKRTQEIWAFWDAALMAKLRAKNGSGWLIGQPGAGRDDPLRYGDG